MQNERYFIFNMLLSFYRKKTVILKNSQRYIFLIMVELSTVEGIDEGITLIYKIQICELNTPYYQELYELRQYLRLWHVPVTICFVKVTNDYV